MKKIIFLLILICVPYFASAKFYDATIVLYDETSLDILIEFPLTTLGEDVVIKWNKNDPSESYSRKEIKLIKVHLNDKKDAAILLCGKMGHFKKDQSFKPITKKENKYALTRLQSVHGNLAYSENGFKYSVKHQKGEDRLYLIYSDNLPRGRNVSKINDTLTLHLIIKGLRLHKAFERQAHYLYSDCPEVLEKLDSEGIDGPKKVLEFVENNRNCDTK